MTAAIKRWDNLFYVDLSSLSLSQKDFDNSISRLFVLSTLSFSNVAFEFATNCGRLWAWQASSIRFACKPRLLGR